VAGCFIVRFFLRSFLPSAPRYFLAVPSHFRPLVDLNKPAEPRALARVEKQPRVCRMPLRMLRVSKQASIFIFGRARASVFLRKNMETK